MAKKPKKTGAAAELLACLNFLSLAQHKEGEAYKLHCKLQDGFGYAFDGVIACGIPLNDTIDAQPRTDVLIAALKRCGETLSVTELETQLGISSGSFRVKVPCDPTPLVMVAPDPPSVAVQARLAASLEILAGLPEEDEQRLACRSVLLQSGSAAASHRGHVIVEAWHGYPLDFAVNLPIKSVRAILKCGKTIEYIGYSHNSFTVYFEDKSWIRTQLDEGSWPDYAKSLDVACTLSTIPADFFTAIKTIKEFSTDERLRLREGQLQTHDDEAQGSVYECEGVKGTVTYKAAYLEILEGIAQEADFYTPRGCVFVGVKDEIALRGAIAKITGE